MNWRKQIRWNERRLSDAQSSTVRKQAEKLLSCKYVLSSGKKKKKNKNCPKGRDRTVGADAEAQTMGAASEAWATDTEAESRVVVPEGRSSSHRVFLSCFETSWNLFCWVWSYLGMDDPFNTYIRFPFRMAIFITVILCLFYLCFWKQVNSFSAFTSPQMERKFFQDGSWKDKFILDYLGSF